MIKNYTRYYIVLLITSFITNLIIYDWFPEWNKYVVWVVSGVISVVVAAVNELDNDYSDTPDDDYL